MICDNSCADSVALCKHVGKMLAHGVVTHNDDFFFKHVSFQLHSTVCISDLKRDVS